MGWDADANMEWSIHDQASRQRLASAEDLAVQPIRRLARIRGVIRDLEVRRDTANFFFTSGDQAKFGILAIASAWAGLDGQAATASRYASDMEEVADRVHFRLGEHLVQGWLWRNPFREGDAVVAAACWVEDHWELLGVARPVDRIIALYPHCSRGSAAHYKNALKWSSWGIGTTMTLYVGFMWFVAGNQLFMEPEVWEVVAGAFASLCLMCFSLTRKWLPFVRSAQTVFRTLGLPDPSNVDLVKTSKHQRRPGDPGEFGTFYFRY